MLKKFIRQRRYYIFRASEETLPAIVLEENLDFGILTLTDLENTPMVHKKNRLQKFKKRWAEGHLCYGHRDTETNNIASYFWVTTEQQMRAPFTFGLDIFLPQNCFYIWDCRVDQSYRRQGLYSSGLISLKNHYRAQAAIIVSETKNNSSTKGILRAGFAKTGAVSFTNIGGFNVIKRQAKSKSEIPAFKKHK